MLTHEDDARIPQGEVLPPISVLLEDLCVISDLFENVDITVMDGDVTDAEIVGLNRESITLYGFRRPFDGWDPEMGTPTRLISTLCTWMDDDRFEGGRGKWRTWDDLTLCENCHTELSLKANACEACDGDPSTPVTPSVLHFSETRLFEDSEVGDFLPVENSAGLVTAIFSVIDTHHTPDWWRGEPKYLIGLPNN